MFADRMDAGRKLTERLHAFADRTDVKLFALPRGGVIVGAEIAKALHLPLDLIVTRKIGAPDNEEYAVGALAETGEVIWNTEELMARGQASLQPTVDREKEEAVRRIKTYRSGRTLPELKDMTALIVDDGVATGLTMRAAIAAAKHQHAKEIVIAVPHGAKDTLAEFRQQGLTVIALDEPARYGSVGQYYETFPQTTDDEVVSLMKTYGPK